MKKIISLMLVLVFVFTISACNSKNASSDTDTSIPIDSKTLVKPKNYASVLLVSINPRFKLYLDENNNVLAVEPVNEDAKSFSNNIDFESKSIETVIGNIVEQANKSGFIKENVTVNFEITEQKNGISNSDILSKVVSAANQKATELNIEIETQIKENNNSQTTETNSENSQPTTTIKQEESTLKPTENKPTHTHKFSAATCTEPQKCSCGVTNGNALGHKWQDATCKAPETCNVCKVTDGTITEHKYENFVCVYCACKDEDRIAIATNPKLSFKPKSYITKNSEDYVYKYGIAVSKILFKEGIGIYQYYYHSTDYINSPNYPLELKDTIMLQECITYNNNKYYRFNGQGQLYEDWYYELTDKYIIVYGDSIQKLKLTLNTDGTLNIVESKESWFKVGTILQ